MFLRAKNWFQARSSETRWALGMGLAALTLAMPMAYAQTNIDSNPNADRNIVQNTCSKCPTLTDPLDVAVCKCQCGQAVSNMQTAGYLPQKMSPDSNEYTKEMTQNVPGTASPNAGQQAQQAVSKGCYGLTKDAFDGVLKSLGGFMGVDIGSLLGGMANYYNGQICGQVNKAIASNTSMACPRVNIPGLPANCNVNVGVNSSGVYVGGGGGVGGWSTSGSANSGINGVYNASGGYNAGQGNTSYGNTNGSAQQSSGGSWISDKWNSATNTVSCWFGGANCPP